MPSRTRRTGARPGGKPTIKHVMEAFIADRPVPQRGAAQFALELLEGCLNGYAYQSLKPADARLFHKLYNTGGAAHREYCEMFGVEHLVAELRQFFEWFLLRKVMARPKDLEVVARETGRFVAWLGERGDLVPTAAAAGVALAAEAASALPAAERVAELLRLRMLDAPWSDGEAVEGQFRVARLAPGKLWLESAEDGKKYGPFAVSRKVTAGLKVGWELSGAVGRVGRTWKLLEVWNVYPTAR